MLIGKRDVHHRGRVGAATWAGRVVMIGDTDRCVRLQLARVVRAARGVGVAAGARPGLAANVGDPRRDHDLGLVCGGPGIGAHRNLHEPLGLCGRAVGVRCAHGHEIRARHGRVAGRERKRRAVRAVRGGALLNAGTSGTRSGVAPCGRGWLAPAIEVITMSPIAPTARASGNTIRRLAVAIEPPFMWSRLSASIPAFRSPAYGRRAATITCVTVVEVDTPHGPAHAHLHLADRPRAALVLGHGAGGGVTAPDLVAVTEAARSEGVSVALVEQPYRVAGRRAPAPARQLDAAWTAVIDHLRRGRATGVAARRRWSLPRARAWPAAPRTRRAPWRCCASLSRCSRPAGPASGRAPSRLSELDAVAVPTLVVQGVRDQFGMPPAADRRTVVQVPGDHSLRKDLEAVAAAVRDWLPGVVAQAADRHRGPGRCASTRVTTRSALPERIASASTRIRASQRFLELGEILRRLDSAHRRLDEAVEVGADPHVLDATR